MKSLNILVACEESQAICIELRRLGYNAFSCDLEDCSGGHPEWHIKDDVLNILSPVTKFDWSETIEFTTCDGLEHSVEGEWDLIIAHPPCTYLTTTGNRWFNVERYGEKAIQRAKDRELAVDFFMQFVNAKCKHICIENPVGIMSTRWKKPTQIIQPYEFGDPFEKRTCLWMIGLKPIKPTNIVQPEARAQFGSSSLPKWYADAAKLPAKERARVRSKTFPGIANAIATQLTQQIEEEEI